MIYPKKIAIPVTAGDGEIWTQVYVPVMEAVSAGSGEQYARLQLDWSSLTLVSKPTEDSTEPSTETPSTGQPSTEQPGNNGNQNPSSEKADKSGLHTLLLSATSLSGRENVYTKESLEALKKRSLWHRMFMIMKMRQSFRSQNSKMHYPRRSSIWIRKNNFFHGR